MSPYLRNCSINETLADGFELVHSAYDWVTGAKSCQFQADTVLSLNSSLSARIKGQDEGINFILNAFSSWELQKASGVQEPLVLAITGPTGVGKSESAFRIGQALFQHRSTVSSRDRRPPCLLFLRGEDYSAEDAAAKGVGELQRLIRSRIVDHISSCGGRAVVVVDEIQKIAPGALDVLMPGLEERGSFTATTQVDPNSVAGYVNKLSGQSSSRTVHVSTADVVFVFISDIGADLMTKMLLVYGDRSLIPKSVLRNEVKVALDEQWTRLRFGKVVREVVPFLPLEPPHIKAILVDKIARMATDLMFVHWLDLIVNDDLVEHMVGPTFVKYSVNFPKQRVSKADSAGLVYCGEDGSGCAAGSAVSGDSSSDDAARAKSKIFATWGARALENAGPLQDLRSMLQRYARPWRVDKVLHVGLMTPSIRERLMSQWSMETYSGGKNGASGGGGGSGGSDNQVYIQWCSLDPMHPPLIDDSVALSPLCETVWYGVFPS